MKTRNHTRLQQTVSSSSACWMVWTKTIPREYHNAGTVPVGNSSINLVVIPTHTHTAYLSVVIHSTVHLVLSYCSELLTWLMSNDSCRSGNPTPATAELSRAMNVSWWHWQWTVSTRTGQRKTSAYSHLSDHCWTVSVSVHKVMW